MADELRGEAVLVVETLLEWQQAQHEVEEARHLRDAPLAPGPHLRADVLHRGDAGRVQRRREVQVELGCVHTHEHVWPLGEDAVAHPAAQPEQPRQVRQDLEQAHDREALRRLPALAALRLHPRARDAKELRLRPALAHRADERRAEIVAGQLAGDHGDAEWMGRGHHGVGKRES
jgi:hypothetical protein